MSKTEKIITGVVIAVLITAFSIYGVWEDKAAFLSFLIPLLYLALACWAVRQLGFRQRPDVRGQQSVINSQYSKEASSDLRSPTSDLRPLTSETHTPPLPHSHTQTPPDTQPSFAAKAMQDKPSSVLRSPSSGISIPPAGGMLLLFWLYSAIMIPFAVIPYEAKISTLRFGCYVGTYWAVANIVSRFPRRKAVWCTLFTALLAVALYSLVQHKINPEHLFGLKRYTSYWEGGRLGGTYQCPNHIAHLFQMWIPLCAVFLFIPQMSWFWRICFGYALPVFCLLIYQTQSRAGLLGMIASIGTLFLLLMLRRSRKSFVLALVAAPLLMAAAVGGLWAGSSMFRDRMQPVVKVLTKASQGEWEQVASLDFRPMTWFDAFEMAGERPWFGYGPGNYGQTFPEHRKRWKGVRRETVHPHNEPLELVTEYGVVGTGLFVAVLIAFCVPLIRLMKPSAGTYHALPAAACLAALAGTLVHGLFDFELRIFPNALMLSVLAGCAVAPLLAQKTEDRGRKAEDGGRRTEDGGRKAEDGRQRTEGRGRRTEDGRRTTEDRGRKTGD